MLIKIRKRNFLFLLTSILSLQFISICDALCEPNKKDGFFDNNFANSTFDKDERDKLPGQQPTSSAPNVAKQKVEPKKDEGNIFDNEGDDQKDQNEVGTPKADTNSMLPENSEGEGEALKTYSVGAILDGNDPEHLVSGLKELIKTADKYNVAIKELYVSGNPIKSQLSALTMLMLQGMDAPRTFLLPHMKTMKDLPEEYSQVAKSPTWIVLTEKGKILLEGVNTLNTHFDSKGRFKIPTNLETEPTPVPKNPAPSPTSTAGA